MVLGRVYRSYFSKVAVTAAQDLFEIVSPADSTVALLGWGIGQSSDLGDAAEEILNIAVKSGQTVSGSGGSSPTVNPNSLGDAAFGGTVEANNTTKANTGTIATHDVREVNIRTGLDVYYIPEDIKLLSPSARLTLELIDAPADSLTMSGYIIFAEIGG
jgi:hypothetical protein